MTLPIILIPESLSSTWQNLERDLNKIAAREKSSYENPKDRVVNNALSLAQHYAKNRQWSSLYSYLNDRKIVAKPKIKAVRQPKPKVIKPPKPKRIKPKANRKKVAPKLKKVKKITRRSKCTSRFSYPKFEYNLLVLLLFTTIIGFFAAYPKLNRGNPNRVTLHHRLTHKDHKGYLYLVSSKRAKGEAKALLIEWSKKYCKEVLGFDKSQLFSSVEGKKAAIKKRKISTEALNKALNGNWQTVGAIARKLSNLLDREVAFVEATRLLQRRQTLGEVYQYKGNSPISLYSFSPNAEIIEREWLTLDEAYQLIKERGATICKNTFRNRRDKVHVFGLEFREKVPAYENPLLRWRSRSIVERMELMTDFKL